MFRVGLQFDTNISIELKKKFETAFGFGPGEQWFGVVVWNESENGVSHGLDDDDGAHGELVLFSKRALPTHKVIVDKASQQITLVDHPSAGSIPFSVR